jgi:glycosyltransferase involved in cell wall biosynthesis
MRSRRADRMKLSIIIPVYNEATLLAKILPAILEDAHSFSGGAEIFFVDNGSRDRTAELLDTASAQDLDTVKHCRLDVPDYGEALRAGLTKASGAWRATMDLDAWNPVFIRAAAARLHAGAHIVVGCKNSKQDTRPAFRRWTTGLHRAVLGRLFPELRGLDVHGPLLLDWERCASAFSDCRAREDVFKTEFLLFAVRSGLHVVPEPIAIAELRPARTSVLKRIFRYLPMLWRLKNLHAPESIGN